MSIMFIDHDGVLCLEQNWGTRQKNGEDFDNFDQCAVRVLNEICEATDTQIVVSSDWRHHLSLEKMRELYLKRGIFWLPIGFTPLHLYTNARRLEEDRIIEIQAWLKQHNMENAKYQILCCR